MKKPVVIIGGGVAGLWCARELAALGHDCAIVEASAALGGHTAKLCCKATNRCRRCGACLLEDVLHHVKHCASITTLLSTTVQDVEIQNGGFAVTLVGEAGALSAMEASAVVIASGFTAFDPSEKPRFGYGRVPGVVTGLELESRLRENSENLRDVRKVAFIQCVGSRDPKIGRNYCSRVCCGYAMRLARLLKDIAPDILPSMFYMDMQSFDRDFERRLAEAEKEVKLIRSIPSEIRSGPDARPELIYHGPDDNRVVESYDLAVLSVGISPNATCAALGEMLGLRLNSDGFFGKDGEEVAAGRDGVFVAGTAQGPRSIEETVSHAIRTAGEVASYVGTVSGGKPK
ncbi:MAG TPA: FAD-dependent oxidoreductase [Desulfomonilaceae bacterium]|nr:FAD-dependent oxidoreductase [Desulfomonilaceae bacterium]